MRLQHPKAWPDQDISYYSKYSPADAPTHSIFLL
jgi:hypothetical protein